MSGTGVQSAMRRRTRPPEENRRPIQTNTTSGVNQRNSQENNNQRLINPGQILYMHQQKITELENKLSNIDGIKDSKHNGEKIEDNIKEKLENLFDKKINIINNNLNFILNSLNEEKGKVRKLESDISSLLISNKELQDKLETKANLEDIDKYLKTSTNTSVDIDSQNDELVASSNNSIESVETISIKGETNGEDLDKEEKNNVDSADSVENVENINLNNISLEGIDLSTLSANDNNDNNSNNITHEISELPDNSE